MPSQQLIISEKRGDGFAILSGLLYGLLGYFGMVLIRSGLSPFNLSFWRFFLSLVFLWVIFISQPMKNLSNFKEHIKAVACGALFYSGPSTLFFIASQYIGTGQSMVIFFSFPAFVMVLNRIIY